MFPLSGKTPQMAALCWIAGALVLLLSAGNTVAVLDQNELAGIVDDLLNKYRPHYDDVSTGQRKYPMFSMAVTVPYNERTKSYDVGKVKDSAEEVRNTILGCEVYRGSRVVAATLLKWPDVLTQCPNGRVQWHVPKGCPTTTWEELDIECHDAFYPGKSDHAEYRTLQHINTLLQSPNKNDLLLFFSRASPCDNKCTKANGHWSILGPIKQIKKWTNHAFVFSLVFKPHSENIPEEKVRGSLERVGNSVGLNNIFRCHKTGNRMHCQRCSSGGQVAPYCISDDLQPQQGRSQSPSKSGHGSGSHGSNRGGEGRSSRQSMSPIGYGSTHNRGNNFSNNFQDMIISWMSIQTLQKVAMFPLSGKTPQMAALCWIAGALVLLLSAGNTVAVLDQNELAGIVDDLLNKYRPSYYDANRQRSPMFSMAVTIPYNERTKSYDVREVTDSAEEVRNTILGCEVYRGSRVVAATLLKWPDVVTQCPNGRVQWKVPKGCPSTTWAELYSKCPKFNPGGADHAEYRTLQGFNTLLQNPNKNDLLLFFILASPCSNKCTRENGKWSILGSINQILNWNNHAIVFSLVFRPRSGQNIPEEELHGALERLGSYQGSLGSIGLNNIFRCYGRGSVQCLSCSSGGQVAPYCISDDLQPQQGRSQSPSKSGQGPSGVSNQGGRGGSSGLGRGSRGYSSASKRGGRGGFSRRRGGYSSARNRRG
ncbi:uncharacterized protein V6R79_018180 [Siganus canaliculatus]